MKILHVITNLEIGGAEKLLVDLLPRINLSGISVELALFVSTNTPFYRLLKDSGIKIHEFSHKGSVYDVKNIYKLIKIVPQFDIVHTHNTAPQLFGAIASLFNNVKWVTTEHTTTNNHRVWWFKPIEKWMYNRYNRIICISEAVQQNMHAVAGNCVSSSVICNGIDTKQYYRALPVHKRDISKNPNRKVLIMVGRMSYQKDQATIIRAMNNINIESELWLVGDGERECELKDLVKDLGLCDRVLFLGKRTDIPALLKASDIAIQSSHIEGFGLAAVEAMAVGLPIVAAKVPGLSQVVDGAGLLFQHGNYNELASIINRLLAQSVMYKEIAKACANRAKNYDISTMTQNYINVYNNLIGYERI